MQRRKRSGVLVAVLLFILGFPDTLRNLSVWAKWVSYADTNLIRYMLLLCALLIVACLFSQPVLDFLRRKLRGIETKVELLPSSGPSPDLRLTLTNHGESKHFSAKCEILALRNGGNPLRKGVYWLSWIHSDSPQVVVRKNDSENLLIATFTILHFHDEYDKFRMGQVDLWELRGDKKAVFESSRWTMIRGEPLPEYDLDIKVFTEGMIVPFVTRFTVRPKHYNGPLEMVSLGQQ